MLHVTSPGLINYSLQVCALKKHPSLPNPTHPEKGEPFTLEAHSPPRPAELKAVPLGSEVYFYRFADRNEQINEKLVLVAPPKRPI